MPGKKEHTDQTGHSIRLYGPPQRIISLVPSQTELLHDLGLEDRVAGITKFCIHPEGWFRNKPRIGGTKTVDLEKVRKLRPDLILANREENDKSQVVALRREFPVWTSDILNLDDALEMIRAVGEITGTEDRSGKMIQTIRKEFDGSGLKESIRTAAYLIWKDPWMAAGSDTFISDMLSRCGLKNIFEEKSRYPETGPCELKTLKPDLILLSSEPYPFKEAHVREMQELLPESAVLRVDGEMFSWYGSRLQKAPRYFKELLNSLPQQR